MNFTDQIAAYIDEKQLDPRHLTIVLPSERAIKYISASLYNRKGKPLLAPEMITIDRWIRKFSEKTVIDRTRLLVKLFKVQMENPADPKDASFDEFMSWGQILLSDFDEIDRYQLSSAEVFRNLADIREIENWSFNSTDPTPAQKRFMEFWDRLPGYYTRLNEMLDDDGVCYMGKAYRNLAENLDKIFRTDPKRHFIFAGFNALSAAEISIMKQLYIMGRGHILIDADAYYLNDPVHESGLFLRNLLKELGVNKLPFVQDKLATDPKEINVIECVQQTGQVKSASTILQNMSKEEIDNTLILLADEGLVVPLMRNIPAVVEQANISLGLPMRSTAIRTWIELLFNIQENKQRFRTNALYFQDLQKLWNHPFLTAILNDKERSKVIELELEAIQRNRIFRNEENIKVSEKLDQILHIVAQPWEGNWVKALELIRKTISLIAQNLPENDEFNQALAEGFDGAIIDFQNIVNEGLPEMNLRSFRSLMQQHWMNKSIAYHGNPINGLQIMGLLETRLLDFKNIIVLGLNEGKMPPTNPIQTMIPMDLRAWLKLPTPREKQGLFAHHFYRLLHKCEKMWVTYSSARESIGSNEASRYLLQMELELCRKNSAIKWTKLLYNIPEEGNVLRSKQSVFKTPEMTAKMDEIFQRSTSASALNKYLACPLDFYYRYVLEFGEEEEFEEDLESRTIGNFIHTVLEQLYLDFVRHDKDGNKKTPQPPAITSFDVEGMLKRYELLVRQQFMKHYNNDERSFLNGKNFLSFNMTLELTKRILESERDFLRTQKEPMFIEFLELEIKIPLKLTINGVEKEILLKGFIDRIDSIGDKVRIVDYKSGKVKSEDVKMKLGTDPESLLKGFSGAKHAVQLAMYSYLYREKFGELPNEVGLYSMINVKNGIYPLNSAANSLADITEAFPEFIQTLLENMYNEAIPFEHTVGWNSYCLYCEK